VGWAPLGGWGAWPFRPAELGSLPLPQPLIATPSTLHGNSGRLTISAAGALAGILLPHGWSRRHATSAGRTKSGTPIAMLAARSSCKSSRHYGTAGRTTRFSPPAQQASTPCLSPLGR